MKIASVLTNNLKSESIPEIDTFESQNKASINDELESKESDAIEDKIEDLKMSQNTKHSLKEKNRAISSTF